MQLVGENWSCLVSRTLLTAFNPEISIVGNILIISKFTSLQSVVKVNVNPGKMYSLTQTHNVGNPARVTTSKGDTAIENLSVFVEKCLYSEDLNINSRVKVTFEILTI